MGRWICELGFAVAGSPRIRNGVAALSPSQGSLRQPNRSAAVPAQLQGKALQELSRLVLDTPPSHQIVDKYPKGLLKWWLFFL